MTNDEAAPTRTRRLVDVLAVVAGGSYGAVAGGLLAGLLAAALGAPTGTGEGEILPAFGWNRFTAFVAGLPVGFAAGATVTLRAARRWPWLAGAPVAIVGAFVIVVVLADPSQWRATFWLPVVPALPGVAFLAWRRRRRARSA